MSGNLNLGVKTSSTIEGDSPDHFITFQDGDEREGSEAVSTSEDREKSGETEIIVSPSQDLKKKEDPEAVDLSQDIYKFVETEKVSTFKDLEIKKPKVVDTSIDTENIETEFSKFLDFEKKESKSIDTSEGIKKKVGSEENGTCQDRKEVEETEVHSTSQDLDIIELKVVDTSEDIKKKVETEEVSTCQGREKIEKKDEPEAICTYQEIEKISETEAVHTLEATEDSFSEGSIHIRVSEPFSLTEDLELYLSEGNSDDGTENVADCLSEPPLQYHIEEVWLKQDEVINGEVNPTIPHISGQGAPVSKAEHSNKSEKSFLSLKPCSVKFTNLESNDNPSEPDQVADTDKYVYSNPKPKRRGRPPKSVIKNKSFLSLKPCSVKFTNLESNDNPSKPDQVADTEKHVYSNPKPKRRGRPPKSVITNYSAVSDDSSNKKVKQTSLKEIGQSVNRNVCKISKTDNMSINAFDKTVLDEKTKRKNLVEPSSSSGHAFKRNTVNILTPKDLINQTLVKLMSGNVSRSQKKALGKGKKKVISDIRKESSLDKSEKMDISGQSTPDDSNINMNSRSKRGFKSIEGLGERSTKCLTSEIKPLPAIELFTDKGNKNLNNSGQTNTCISINSSPNEDCKRQLNFGKSSNKSHSVTMITPRDLISRTLEKLTCRKFPQTKQKTSVQEENSKTSNLSSEQLIEKRKKEELQRELINRTLAKLTSGALPKSKQEKSGEEIKINDLSAGPCITKEEEEEVSKKKPVKLRAVIPRKSKSRAQIVIPLKLMENSKGRVTSSSLSECKEEELQKAISIHKDNFEKKNQTAMMRNENCKNNIPMDEPSSKIDSILEMVTLKDPNLKNKKNTRPKPTLEVKNEFCSTSDVVSRNGKNIEKASQKTSVKREKLCIEDQDQILFKSPVIPNVKCLKKDQLGEKNKKSCPTLNGLTNTEAELVRGKHQKSKQSNSKEKVFRKKTRFASNLRRKKQLQKIALSKNYNLKINKQLAKPLNKKCKRKVQMDRQNSLSFKMAVANKESISLTGQNSKTDEIIPEDRQEKCSISSPIPSIDPVKYKEQIKANPRVCLVDYKKIGLCASNEDVVSKCKFQVKNDLSLKQVTCIQNQTDNHMIVDSGEYFTQLELSPFSKSPRFNSEPLKSVSTSSTEKKVGIEKGSQINKIAMTNDYSDLCSTSASLPAHNLEGSKQCSVGSSQKPVSIENLPASKSPRVRNVPLQSLSTSPKNKRSTVEKGYEIIEIVVLDDDDDDDYSELCSTSASLPPHSLEGSKQCSVGSSQKSVSIENVAIKKGPGQNVPTEHVNSTPREQPSSCKKLKHAFSLSTHVQKDNINHSNQFQSSSVTQPQSILETRNYQAPNSVRKDNNLITTKLKKILPKPDLPQSKQSITSHLYSNIIKYSSSNNIIKGPTSHSTLIKKGIPPLMPGEILTTSTWIKEMPSNSCRISGDSSSILPPNVPISAPVLPNKILPVASGSKNYYFTPLFVLDGEKVVPLNASNASSYSVGNYNTPNSQLKSGHKYCKSTVTKMSHSQMIIDSKTIKPLPAQDLAAILGSSVVSPSIASSKLDLLSINQSLSSINQKTKGNSGSFTVSSTQPDSTNPEPATKRKRVGSDGAGTRNDLYQDVVHCLSSTHSNIESDHLTGPKRRKHQALPVTKYIYADHGSTKKLEPPTKRTIFADRKQNSNECEHHEEESVSSMDPSIECYKPTSPKRKKYQEHHKTNHIPVQPSEKMPEVSSSNCYEPDPNNENLGSFSGNNEMTTKNLMSNSMSQNQKKQLNCQTNFNKQLKGNGGNLNTLSGITNKTKENMPVCVPKSGENKPSGSPKQENKQGNSEKGSLQNKNKQVKSSLEENVDKQSDSLKKNKQVNSKKMDGRIRVKKRIKSKEEDLEECLDGVPPFIQEVFNCDNIRDGFDNRDLIFVLSLLPDIEEMTSAQRVIFQSRAIKIINDVFTNTKPQSVIKSVKT